MNKLPYIAVTLWLEKLMPRHQAALSNGVGLKAVYAAFRYMHRLFIFISLLDFLDDFFRNVARAGRIV